MNNYTFLVEGLFKKTTKSVDYGKRGLWAKTKDLLTTGTTDANLASARRYKKLKKKDPKRAEEYENELKKRGYELNDDGSKEREERVKKAKEKKFNDTTKKIFGKNSKLKPVETKTKLKDKARKIADNVKKDYDNVKKQALDKYNSLSRNKQLAVKYGAPASVAALGVAAIMAWYRKHKKKQEDK